MGFGGGSHFGGSSFHVSYSSSYSSSYSGYSRSGKSACSKLKDKCYSITYLIGIGVGLLFIGGAVGFYILFLSNFPVMTVNPCVPGSYLNPVEQMWCSPKETANVNVTFNSTNVKVYRAKIVDLPKVSFIQQHIEESFPMSAYRYSFYRFEAMAGTRVTATLSSTKSSDKCYLLTSSQFSDFTGDDGFTYTKRGKGSLFLESYEFEKAGAYYLVVDHNHLGSATASFDMVFEYAVYNMSAFTPSVCVNNSCLFENVTVSEIVIAENQGTYDYYVTVRLPGTVSVFGCIFAIAFPSCFAVCGCIPLLIFVKEGIRKCRRPRYSVDSWDALLDLDESADSSKPEQKSSDSSKPEQETSTPSSETTEGYAAPTPGSVSESSVTLVETPAVGPDGLPVYGI